MIIPGYSTIQSIITLPHKRNIWYKIKYTEDAGLFRKLLVHGNNRPICVKWLIRIYNFLR
jgi:hypothetical protein